MMTARAVLERVPAGLYARARDRLRESLRAGAGASPTPRAWAVKPRSTCFSARPTPPAARSRRRAWRARTSPRPSAPIRSNTVALAVCAAALGETRAAIAELEIVALHPGPGRSDRFQLRDLYLANDWDRLRGDPKFESLFPR